METQPAGFIDEQIEVAFKQPLALEKKPTCPDAFLWRNRRYTVVGMLEEWFDFQRRGRMARNMAPAHAAAASVRGSWGVGRFFFRVRVDTGQIFDLYYDRAPKDAGDRKGRWVLFRERIQAE